MVLDVNESDFSWIEVTSRRKSGGSTVIRAASNPLGSTVIRAAFKPQTTIDVGLIDHEGKQSLRKVGAGKITIDSGAGESVCPIDMGPDEPLHMTAKNRAGGGQSLINKGEKRIKFRSGTKLGKMNLQAIDEFQKPLASAAKIANKGNIIVLDVDGCDSCVFNKESKQKVQN